MPYLRFEDYWSSYLSRFTFSSLNETVLVPFSDSPIQQTFSAPYRVLGKHRKPRWILHSSGQRFRPYTMKYINI